MYNKNTGECIARLEEWFKLPEQAHWFTRVTIPVSIETLLSKQIKGMAMGMFPLPPIANLFVAIFENKDIIPQFKEIIDLLQRFIDDGFGVSKHHPNPAMDEERWTTFKDNLNKSDLKLIFEQGQGVVFMDMTIEIEGDKHCHFTICKKLALHLYIPPKSCHAPGIITDLIYGVTLWIYQLCLKE